MTGQGLAPGVKVDIGGAACTGVVVTPPTSLTCVAPAGTSAGPAVVTVSSADGDVTVVDNLLTYKAIPTVSSVAPSTGPIAGGTTITVSGSGFDNKTKVTIGNSSCTFVNVTSDTSLTCTVPANSSGPVNVSVQDSLSQVTSLKSGFTYAGAPTIITVSPTSGSTSGGDSVTVSGTNFTAASTIAFGGTFCATTTFLSANALSCTTPPRAAGVVDVMVTNPDGQAATSSGAYTFASAGTTAASQAAVTLTGISPSLGPVGGGTVLSLAGSGFASGMAIKIGSTACTNILVSSPTSATCTTAAGNQGQQNVSISVGSVVAGLGNAFTYVSGVAPSIAAVSPNFGPISGGTSVTILGSGFVSGVQVSIGGMSCSNVVLLTGGSLTCSTPASSYGPKTVIVTNPDSQTATLTSGYTYSNGAAPSLTSVSPSYGPATGGTALTISGINFATGAVVTVNGAYCNNTVVVTSSSITCNTPPGAWTGSVNKLVQVTNPDGNQSSSNISTGINSFAYSNGAAPTIISTTPNYGPAIGGTTLTIVGSNFATGAVVTVNGLLCQGTTVTGGSTITCTTPAASWTGASAKLVQVTNPDTQQSSSVVTSGVNSFAYSNGAAPTVTNVSPSFGPAAGGTSISVVGSNFAPGAVVTINGLYCTTVVVNSPTSITCTTPASSY